MYASWIGNETTFQVKYLNDNHRCSRSFEFGTLVTPSWIAKHYVDEMIRNPTLKIRELKDGIRRKFSFKVSTPQCQRARANALFLIEGKLSDHYAKVWDYGQEFLG